MPILYRIYSHSPSYNHILIWYQIVRGETLKTYITTIYVCVYIAACALSYVELH